MCLLRCWVFLFKQKTADEMRISDWSSDVCSSDLPAVSAPLGLCLLGLCGRGAVLLRLDIRRPCPRRRLVHVSTAHLENLFAWHQHRFLAARHRSEEHTSELQSLMRISYAVFCLKKKINHKTKHTKMK